MNVMVVVVLVVVVVGGPGSTVGIAANYMMDGPGSNPGWAYDFPPVKTALWPAHPPL